MTPRRALPNRRSVLASIAAAGAFAATGARAQSNWPDHPVRIVVPYPAGGSTDVLSRILAERMKEMFGQPFVIENRPGAGGNIGIAAVTGSPPDGYTIGAATIGHFAINQYLYSKMPYDAEKRHVALVARLGITQCRRGRERSCTRRNRCKSSSPGQGAKAASSTAVPASVRRHIFGVLFVLARGLMPCTCRSAEPRRPFRRCYPAT